MRRETRSSRGPPPTLDFQIAAGLLPSETLSEETEVRETDGRGEGRMEGGKRKGQEGRASTVRKDERGHGTAVTRQDEARCLSPA